MNIFDMNTSVKHNIKRENDRKNDMIKSALDQRRTKTLPSKIEKVQRGIRGEKSSKDMASSRNLVSTIGALASPKWGTEPGVRKGKRPCWHATPVAKAPWKPLIIGEGQARYQGHEIIL